jgi:hypothetical protein
MSDAPKKKTGKKGAASKKKKGTKDPGPAPSGAAPGPNKDPQPPAIESMARLDSVQRDWVQREWIEHVNLDIKKIVDFLNKFGTASMICALTILVDFSTDRMELPPFLAQNSQPKPRWRN